MNRYWIELATWENRRSSVSHQRLLRKIRNGSKISDNIFGVKPPAPATKLTNALNVTMTLTDICDRNYFQT